MAKQISFGSIYVDNTTSPAAESSAERVDLPLQILILSNLTGDARQQEENGAATLAGGRPLVVDRDNVDGVLARFRPTLSLDGIKPRGERVEIAFTELDDFHPDRLYDRVELFDELRGLRDRLGKPTTFAAAADELLALAGAAGASEIAADAQSSADAPQSAPATTVSGEDLLAQMLGEPPVSARRAAASREASEFRRILDQVAAPHRIATDDPRLGQFVELADALTADRMRAILHHPAFQALEAAWRGIHLLTRRLQTDANLKIFVLDCPKETLVADLEAADSLRSTAFFKVLAERPAGSPRWGIVVGNYEFAATQPDIEMLGRIAQIAEHAGAPFLAAANSSIFGCHSVAKSPDPDDWHDPDAGAAAMWQQLRRLPQATSLGLTAPHFLLRLPYGNDSSPLEHFEFVELPTARHEGYLWGNPAFACV
ncbi:MAG TPA: type VI secretion system contractile sheath large subunit, partial [Pirellulales bacterium]|nr:type VI secretion system contractile sheath large subunit [Pirellulales bacterium]